MANKKLIIGVVILLGLIATWLTVYPMGSYRYKITVTVETPEGIKSGFAVRNIHLQDRPHLGGLNRGPATSLKGEAVVVDLGNRGVLFALKDDALSEIRRISSSFPLPAEYKGMGIRYYANLRKTEPVTLPLDHYPRLVYFKDIKDPKSVELAYELETYSKTFPNGGYEPQTRVKSDNFEKAFGKGVKLKEITIEMTDDEVTWGVRKYLPWLPQYHDKMLDGRRINTIEAENQLANSLGSGSFSTKR